MASSSEYPENAPALGRPREQKASAPLTLGQRRAIEVVGNLNAVPSLAPDLNDENLDSVPAHGLILEPPELPTAFSSHAVILTMASAPWMRALTPT